MSTLKSFRLPVGLIARIESIARSKRVKLSAAFRFALERGVAALEKEAEPPREEVTSTARRRMLSRGVGV